jgi:hypothetical protein
VLDLIAADFRNIYAEFTSPEKIGILVVYVIGNFLGAFLTVFVVRKLGAPLVSTLLPWRLVVCRCDFDFVCFVLIFVSQLALWKGWAT